MKILYLFMGIWTLQLFSGLCYTTSLDEFAFPDDPSVVYTYNRFPEIEKQCSCFLSSASELKPDDTRGYRLKNELSFFNGDWEQEASGAPLMPFDDSDMPWDHFSLISPLLKLVSFEVKNVNSVSQSKNTVSLSGVLSIGISRNNTFVSESTPKFQMRPGMSSLRIDFQGIYIEEENGGQRVTCLLGNSTLPVSKYIDDFSDMSFIFDTTNYNSKQPQLLQDDQILLVFLHPKQFNLTKRAIRGELRSLNRRESSKYFDKVHISAQLGHYSKYQFSPEELKLRTCDPNPLHDEMVEDGVIIFDGPDFCKILRNFGNEVYDVTPDWRFSGRYEYHSKLGPFLIKGVDWSHDSVRLITQNIICEVETTQNETNNARVSAVFRLFPSSMGKFVAALRNGLSGTTLSVEGIWNSSTGQLCMIGCPGVSDSGLEGCESQISLYFPRSFSSRQRSIISGSISSIKHGTDSYLPLLFGLVKCPSQVLYDYGWHEKFYFTYNYSKINLAGAFRERSRPSKLISGIREWLLTYPTLENIDEFSHRLSQLSSDFYIDAYAASDPLSYGQYAEIFVKIEILSLGPSIGNEVSPIVGAQAELTNSEVLNVSLHLRFTEEWLALTEKSYKKVSRLFLEGLYDPRVGEMYLIGCRNVMVESINIKRGLDCSIEVKIDYPSESTRWFKNPTAKITIRSQRNEDDPLHFSPISLQTFMLRYRKHEQDVFFRIAFEGVLRVLLLSASIAIILSQFFYMKKNPEIIPYVSLVMLGIQIFGYSLPLISNEEIMFESKESESYRARPYDLHRYQPFLKAIDYSVKLLVLIALLLISRIFNMVLENRRGSIKSKGVPSDKRVLLITLVVPIIWFSIELKNDVILFLFGEENYTGEYVNMLQILMAKFWDYVHLVQDLFMLPQVIGNCLWKVSVKPLKRSYIIGFLVITVLPIIYDGIKDPFFNPYSL